MLEFSDIAHACDAQPLLRMYFLLFIFTAWEIDHHRKNWHQCEKEKEAAHVFKHSEIQSEAYAKLFWDLGFSHSFEATVETHGLTKGNRDYNACFIESSGRLMIDFIFHLWVGEALDQILVENSISWPCLCSLAFFILPGSDALFDDEFSAESIAEHFVAFLIVGVIIQLWWRQCFLLFIIKRFHFYHVGKIDICIIFDARSFAFSRWSPCWFSSAFHCVAIYIQLLRSRSSF